MPSPGHLPNPGIEPTSPALQTDSSPSEPPVKSKNTGVGRLLVQDNEGSSLHRWLCLYVSLSLDSLWVSAVHLFNTHTPAIRAEQSGDSRRSTALPTPQDKQAQ